mgnify:FL=1|tara:strand:- start:186 stop:641 length:456 start_codon:yes stop_codon:yes gene_type:complete
MGTTTFSGPIKAGPISNTTGTTVGTDVADVGYVTMAQSAVPNITGASQLNQRMAVIPANSQIIDVILNVTTAGDDTGAAVISVGTAADADAFLNGINTKAVGTTHGTLDTEATNVGTTDLEVLADFTGATGDGTAGVATVTVLYAQNNNLS